MNILYKTLSLVLLFSSSFYTNGQAKKSTGIINESGLLAEHFYRKLAIESIQKIQFDKDDIWNQFYHKKYEYIKFNGALVFRYKNDEVLEYDPRKKPHLSLIEKNGNKPTKRQINRYKKSLKKREREKSKGASLSIKLDTTDTLSIIRLLDIKKLSKIKDRIEMELFTEDSKYISMTFKPIDSLLAKEEKELKYVRFAITVDRQSRQPTEIKAFNVEKFKVPGTPLIVRDFFVISKMITIAGLPVEESSRFEVKGRYRIFSLRAKGSTRYFDLDETIIKAKASEIKPDQAKKL